MSNQFETYEVRPPRIHALRYDDVTALAMIVEQVPTEHFAMEDGILTITQKDGATIRLVPGDYLLRIIEDGTVTFKAMDASEFHRVYAAPAVRDHR